MQQKITIKGAREHNLKNISLELPRNKMIVFTGLSGSGKSSLAFDTIFAEGQRRYIESLSAYARQFLGGMSKPDVDEIEGLSPGISIDQKAHSANPRSTVATITEIYDYLRIVFARIGVPHSPISGRSLEKMTTDQITARIEGSEHIQTKARKKESIRILAPLVRGRKGEYYQMLYDIYNSGFLSVRVDGEIKSLREKIVLSKQKKHTIEVVVDEILATTDFSIKEEQERLAYAVEQAVDLSNESCIVIYPDGEEREYSTEYVLPEDGTKFPDIEPRLFSFNSPYGYCSACTGLGTKELFSEDICPVCEGKRLNEYALSVKIQKKSIYDITSMTIYEAKEFFNSIEKGLSEKEKEIIGAALREIKNRIGFMHNVGLHYLTLNRKAGTLSGGEAQRIRLASQVGQQLVGAMYVLDEPTIGLHQRDNDQLVSTLRNLCDIGNTIIVVEHDEDTILTSDWVVDIGPGAGVHGGNVVYSGPLVTLLEGKESTNTLENCAVLGSAKQSLTGKYLRGEEMIDVPKKRRNVGSGTPFLKIYGATEHNLKNVNVQIPLRRFVCLTGVSGSGKSTLMHRILYRAIANKFNHVDKSIGKHKKITGIEYLDKVIRIDQSAIGRSPRSNPATYTKAYDHIRQIFSLTAEARIRGYNVGRFSFNRPGGRCEHCEGKGMLDIEMHFLPSVSVVCEVCKGKRFNQETLQVHYNGKNISDVLEMTIEEAEVFFKDIPTIHDKLKVLNDVGLSYLRLGQSSKTLSGGEAQRIKLSRELSKRNTTKTLYLLDEPTTGLHYADVKKLIEVLQRLVNQGNTLMVIEHNLDVIKSADWLIDLGPDGGDKGGELIAAGTPEEIARKSTISYTGKYLKKYLDVS
ncbi:excinuclease ABC subunit UvrA [Patescibacteria group bacterium]|nr:excinuclease ABC subunit UvrA [Patescibacteria group bacterium]MBU1722040.1 excinuclease ABC subunit UvrA [Patescibacteria group bacterium]MBU1901757.1 excinuclease ABC subunit UvrA [Patescibacteria group bacterium]